MICRTASKAKKSYQRDMLRAVMAYGVVLLCSAWFVKHDGHERFYLYFWSLFPAFPVLLMVYRMGVYLREETDEYQRWLTIQSVMAGTGALLGTLVVSDFLQAFARTQGPPPFALFTVFYAGMGVTQAVQWLRNRVKDDE